MGEIYSNLKEFKRRVDFPQPLGPEITQILFLDLVKSIDIDFFPKPLYIPT